MSVREEEAVTVPPGVKLAAVALVVIGIREAVMKALPAFAAGDPDALSELLNLAMLGFLLWGLLTLRRWAWWLAVVVSGAGWMIPTALLGALEVPEFRDALVAEMPDPAPLVQQLVIIGTAAFVAFAALLWPTSRSAFRR